MSHFILVSNGVTSAQFEKALEVQIKSKGAVTFTPQPMAQNSPINNGVSSNGMVSQKINTGKGVEDIQNGVRFEWDEGGAHFGSEIVRLLAHQPTEEPQ